MDWLQYMLHLLSLHYLSNFLVGSTYGEMGRRATRSSTSSRKRIDCTIVSGSGCFHLSDLEGLCYELVLVFWVVFTIIVSMTQIIILTTTLTLILPSSQS